jgi:hypothetical protein
MKHLLGTLCGLALALPAAAGPIAVDIDDDGWRTVRPPAEPALVIDIGDDGWAVVTAPIVSRRSGEAGLGGECSQLEASAGLRAPACGTLDRGQVIRLLTDE